MVNTLVQYSDGSFVYWSLEDFDALFARLKGRDDIQSIRAFNKED